MSNLVVRPLQDGESHLFDSYDTPSVPGVGMQARRTYADTAARREYRPEWTWVALRGDRVVARAAWWGGPDDADPVALDWFDPGAEPDRIEVGARLLAAAHDQLRTSEGERPAYHLFLPVGWRESPDVRVAAEDRIAAAERAGLSFFVERLSYRWSRADGLPKRTDRLVFRPVEDAEFVEVLRRLLDGTLDAHSRRDVERHGLEQAARIQLEDLRWFPSPREWWQLAFTPEGELVGLIVPARNHALPVIGYIGVVPEQRGRGYVDDLLAEMTWRLADASGAEEEIAADTDLGNTPMAAAFTRAGYRNTAVRIVLG
ncbi:GNAT family N-acetyltransferase [Actinopolymorpha alba]|uniref:GNAT family N-acetyltransferase n=1 Tax=Actinopolymorpha alba TaxID=533267 RepID=UPI000360434C|nr:GNAT family protein [Actinopolymorpha alba]